MSHEDYARAERYLPWQAGKRVRHAQVRPNFILSHDSFWYVDDTPRGKAFMRVDPEQGVHGPAFDHARLAAALSVATTLSYDGEDLPFDTFDYVRDGVRFRVGDKRWFCDLASYSCAPDDAPPEQAPGEVRSPDGRWAALVRDGNLWLREVATGECVPLTDDAEPEYGYAGPPGSCMTPVTDRLKGAAPQPLVVWSPDSRCLATHRLDERRVQPLHLLQHVPGRGEPRPVVHSYRVALVGDAHVELAQTVIFHAATRRAVWADLPPLPMPVFWPPEARAVFWDADGLTLYLLQRERGDRAVRLVGVSAETGAARTLIEEHSSTYLEMNLTRAAPNVRALHGGDEVIWFSERDGWAHLYLYDGRAGRLRHQVTRGAWAVRDIVHVDEAARVVYFTAGGREPGREPYYRHLYRVGLAGGEPELLTPEDADHAITVTPSGRYFVDTYGRVDLPPVTVLRTVSGEPMRVLEEADVSELLAEGWRFPDRFRVKARDGVTDLYGVLWRPTRFDPSRRYPVIDDIYPGPQIIRVPKTFPVDDRSAFAFWHPQALAELGFVVVTVDALGTPLRSKAFHDYGYGRMEEAGGLPDHIAGLRALASTRPWMDLSRVGIFGHSGGGFASTRAILAFPEFYKVAVSSAGNHDQLGYYARWGEKYQGLAEGENYAAQANKSLAGALRGKLLLAWGDMDDNVHPAMTIQLVDALIQANKDFEVLILPGRNHTFGSDPYFVRRRWDHFVRHLRGEEPPAEYRIRDPEADARR